MKSLKITAALAPALALMVFTGAVDADENWPQFRGPSQNNVSTAVGLPETWSDTENIVWKTPMPSWSGSSPVIWGDRVFVTSPSTPDDSESGEPVAQSALRGPGGPEILLLCLSKENGEILWQRTLATDNYLRRKHNASSPTPVTDGEHVWTLTGTGVVAAFDMDGNRQWEADLQEAYGPLGLMFGYGSSPLLHDGKLIIQVLHGYRTDDPSYLVAFDALTGEVVWRVERPTDAEHESPDAYTTPTLLEYGAQTQFVVTGGDYVTGHDPQTGEELWRAAGLNPRKLTNYRIISSAVAVDGMIYAPTRRRPLLALRAGGTGDVTSSHLAWQWDAAGGPDVPTPACDGTYFYMVEDRGMVTCLDAKTGEVIWGPEHTARGTVSASPLLADGKLYITNEDGVTTVLAAGPEFKVLAANEVPGVYVLSSFGVSGNQLFLRTATHLYCIGE